jgi:hypothetical protein
MNTKKIYLLLLAATLFILPTHQASAAMTPIAISIVPPIQFPPSNFDIVGFRASVLYGNHRSVSGIDIGLLGNMTETGFTGLAVAGGFNRNKGRSTILGLQLAGIANMNMEQTKVFGLQAALVNYNKAESHVVGLQLGAANMSKNTKVYGVQAGVWNNARDVYGFQIGIVNMVENLHGLQIGLVNFHQNGMFKVAPILNVGF